MATDPHYVEKILRSVTKSQDLWVVRHPQRPGALVAHVGKGPTPKELIQIATDRLHRYEVPTHICAVDRKKRGVTADELAKINPNPKDAVASILSASSGSGVAGGDDPFVSQVQDIFLELLGLDYIPAPDADFFQIGGSSMTASQLASKIRKNFGVACAGAEVFHHSTSIALVELIRARTGGSGTTDDSPQASSFNRRFHLASFESTRLAPRNTYLACLIQLVPMFFVFPVWQISRYLLFFGTLLQKAQWFPWVSDRDFASFLLAYMAFHMLWITFAPLVSPPPPPSPPALEAEGEFHASETRLLLLTCIRAIVYRSSSPSSGWLLENTRRGGTRSGANTTYDGGLLTSAGRSFCVESGAQVIQPFGGTIACLGQRSNREPESVWTAISRNTTWSQLVRMPP